MALGGYEVLTTDQDWFLINPALRYMSHEKIRFLGHRLCL
jgi:hypothetical protein